MITLYGIPNCDTVKKARLWLADHAIGYAFHDYKKAGVPSGSLEQWLAELGWEALLNRQGQTWRKLDDAQKMGITSATQAKALMMAQPSIIRRPLVDWGARRTLGFDPTLFADLARTLR